MCLHLANKYEKNGDLKRNNLGDRLYHRVLNGSSFMSRLNASKKGEITCWKVYFAKNNILTSFWQLKKIEGPGVVISDRESLSLDYDEKSNGEVNQGIHVYTTREKAKEDEGYTGGQYAESGIVPVICKKSDLVAQGNNDDAVFMKVRIEKRTWNKIFKEKKNA